MSFRVPTFDEIMNVAQSRGSNSDNPSWWNGLKFATTFGAGAGERVWDVAGGNHGTWNGTGNHWAVGERGMVALFNGSDDYVSLPDDILTSATNWSVSLWLRNTSRASKESPFGGSLAVFGELPTVRFSSSAEYEFLASTGSSFYITNATTSSVALLNTWERLVFCYNGSDLLVFRDGSLTDTLAAIDGQANHTTITNSRIGGGGSGSALSYNGQIGPLSVHNRILAPSEIQQDYADPRGGYRLRSRVFAAAVAEESSSSSSSSSSSVAFSSSSSSSSVAERGVFDVVDTEIYIPGAVAAEVYVPGAAVAEIYVPGAVAAEIAVG